MSSSAGLVQNGKKSSNVQWPWAVVVFNKALIAYVDNETFSDFEIGSLISEKHVIAAGSYVSKNESNKMIPIATDLIKTYFGVTSIDSYENVNSLVLDGAEKIILHPEFGSIFSLKFANFAIIKLKTKVSFSQFISPVCLSSFTSDPYSLVGKFGYGVGYGYSANGKTKHRFHSPMRVRSKEDCDIVYDFSLGTAKDKRSLYFCAGGDGKNSACWSDHPLYMKINEKWYLHAFMQVAFNDGKGCKVDLPVLYEIAGHYYTFILNEISKN